MASAFATGQGSRIARPKRGHLERLGVRSASRGRPQPWQALRILEKPIWGLSVRGKLKPYVL